MRSVPPGRLALGSGSADAVRFLSVADPELAGCAGADCSVAAELGALPERLAAGVQATTAQETVASRNVLRLTSNGAGVHVPFPPAERRLPVVGGPVSGVGKEIALPPFTAPQALPLTIPLLAGETPSQSADLPSTASSRHKAARINLVFLSDNRLVDSIVARDLDRVEVALQAHTVATAEELIALCHQQSHPGETDKGTNS